jgi:hypothetical protein
LRKSPALAFLQGVKTTISLQPQSLFGSRQTVRGIQTGGNPDMTPLVEVPVDPNFSEVLRMTFAAQPDDYFRPFFDGRLPTPIEKFAWIEHAIPRMTPVRVFQNNIYQVKIGNTQTVALPFIHLAISRLDGGTCNEWADLQRIKNEIVGSEHEAIELFPAESRLVDTGNEYHLWVHSDPKHRFPVGWVQRVVLSEPLRIHNGPLRSAGLWDNSAAQRQIPFGTFILTPVARSG